jgi:hypothetical protein
MFSKAFWAKAGERAVKTVAQTAVSTLSVGAATGLFDVDFQTVASVSLLAGVLSLLTSIGDPNIPGGE